MSTQDLIAEVCDEIKELLLDKNRKYGDSALNPVRIFSKTDALEQIHVRMDDKISRIKAGQLDDDEDPYDDLLGYLVLRKVALRYNDEPEIPEVPAELEKILGEAEKWSCSIFTPKKNDILITYNPPGYTPMLPMRDLRDQYEDGN